MKERTRVQSCLAELRQYVLRKKALCIVCSLFSMAQADKKEAAVVYSSKLELELSTVEPCLSGPKR